MQCNSELPNYINWVINHSFRVSLSLLRCFFLSSPSHAARSWDQKQQHRRRCPSCHAINPNGPAEFYYLRRTLLPVINLSIRNAREIQRVFAKLLISLFKLVGKSQHTFLRLPIVDELDSTPSFYARTAISRDRGRGQRTDGSVAARAQSNFQFYAPNSRL